MNEIRIHRRSEREILVGQAASVMRRQGDLDAVIDVAPFWMVIQLLRDEADAPVLTVLRFAFTVGPNVRSPLNEMLNQHDEVIGHLDGKVFSIGGKWYGELRADEIQAKKLLTVMKLFCGVIMFNRQSRRHVKALWQDVRGGRIEPKLERQEADLYMNPRRVR